MKSHNNEAHISGYAKVDITFENSFTYKNYPIQLWKAVWFGFRHFLNYFFTWLSIIMFQKKMEISSHVEEIKVLLCENIFVFQKEYCVRFSSYWGYSKKRRKKKIAWPYL